MSSSDLQPLDGLSLQPLTDAINPDLPHEAEADARTTTTALRVLAPGARWPDHVPGAAEGLSLEELADQAEAWSDASVPPLLLGYTDPMRALCNLAAGQCEEQDPLTLLETWLSATARFLEWKRRWPAQVRLLHLQAAPEGPEANGADTLDPRLLALLQALPQLAERHADLEGCADLDGREPMFDLGLPPLRSGTFASLCLESWRRDRRAREVSERERAALDNALLELRRQSANQLEEMGSKLEVMGSQLEATRGELEELGSELEALGRKHESLLAEREVMRSELDDRDQELRSLRESEAARAAGNEQRSQELEQALMHTQAASELTLAQLHAVQDTLEQLYGERRRVEEALHQISAEREQLGNEAASLRQDLEALQAEVAHYLRASSPGPQLDRSRIPRLTALLREALHLQ